MYMVIFYILFLLTSKIYYLLYMYILNNPAFHYLISFSVSQGIECSKKILAHYVYDYSKGNYQGLCDYLLQCNFSACYTYINLVWFIPKVQLRATNTQNGLFLNSTQKQIRTYLHTLRQKIKCDWASKNGPSGHINFDCIFQICCIITYELIIPMHWNLYIRCII